VAIIPVLVSVGLGEVTWQGLPYQPFVDTAICCHLCSNRTNRWRHMLSV